MTRLYLAVCIVLLFGLVTYAWNGAAAIGKNGNLIFDSRIKAEDAEVSSHNGRVSVRTNSEGRWPGVVFYPDSYLKPRWDLTDYRELVAEIENLDVEPLVIHLRIDNPIGTNGRLRPWITAKTTIAGKSVGSVRALITRNGPIAKNLEGMQQFPDGLSPNGIDPKLTSSVRLFVARSDRQRRFRIHSVKPAGTYQQSAFARLPAEEFFPFVDKFGQFKHSRWPGKIELENDFKKQSNDEKQALEIEQQTQPIFYEGWSTGPKYEGTGHFRLAKHDGFWWFVDPAGHLFWSHGLNVVRPDNPTVVTNREHYFTNVRQLPKQFLRHTTQANTLSSFDYARFNLWTKYGPNWREDWAGIVLTRLPYWGLNTVGLWSDVAVTTGGTMPFVDWIYYDSPKFKVTQHQKPMPDMWHPDFRSRLSIAAKKRSQLKDNPRIIGLFVDNELPWNDPLTFTQAVLTSEAQQAAKHALVKQLTTRYVSIIELNKRWDTQYSSWKALVQSKTRAPITEAFRKDSQQFMMRSAERYYSEVKDTIKTHIPNKLYLCSRFNGRFPLPERAAAQYCDVLSFNMYRKSVATFSLNQEIDKPVLISEWHFGATDRGVFGSGLVRVANQVERARRYREYAQGALRNPHVIGVHWFQYQDEPITGRPLDGENHQIGFVSIADTPYPETIKASREIGRTMYTIRGESNPSADQPRL